MGRLQCSWLRVVCFRKVDVTQKVDYLMWNGKLNTVCEAAALWAVVDQWELEQGWQVKSMILTDCRALLHVILPHNQSHMSDSHKEYSTHYTMAQRAPSTHNNTVRTAAHTGCSVTHVSFVGCKFAADCQLCTQKE
jgi:hypothetical protein